MIGIKKITELWTTFSGTVILIAGIVTLVMGILLIALNVGICLINRQKTTNQAIQLRDLTSKSSNDQQNQQ